MSDIFISYAREDQPRAEMLAQLLEGRGWSIFWDRTIPVGKTWRETIGSELDDARCVIVLWSKISIKSGWVQDEADEAKRRGVLVPILIQNVQPPMGLRSIQAAHLENWDGTELTQAFGRLIADITALIGPPPNEAENESRQVEIERKAEEERKLAERQAKVEIAVRRKVDEVAAARREAENEKRELPFASMSQAPRSATPELRQQLDHVSRKQPKTAAVPWRIIAGGVIILGVIAIVVVWRPGLSVTLQPTSSVTQPASPVTSQPAPPITPQDARAMYNEGQRSYYGQGVPQDYAKAREWYEKAAANGSTDAMFSLGVLYANGLGVAQDYAKAREWYTKAADKGNAQAMGALAVTPQHSSPMDASAMYTQGQRYFFGMGVAQDYAKAREWYEKAAANGSTDAMIDLGALYYHGQGVAQDYAKAREWFTKAVDKGDASAKVLLERLPVPAPSVTPQSALPVTSQPVPPVTPQTAPSVTPQAAPPVTLTPDYAKARELNEKAAALGSADAMVALGTMYENGRGVPQDLGKAREWYEKAAAKGNSYAIKRLQQSPIR